MGEAQPVVVVGGGERPPDHLRERAAEAELIGVDGGAHWILRWGLVPHRVLGDLDSIDERSRAYTSEYGSPIERLVGDGRRSDLALVADRLLEEGYRHVTFTGCVGHRVDHTLTLFAVMGRLALAGVEVHVVERWGTGHVVVPDKSIALDGLKGEQVAMFPLSPRVELMALTGFDVGEAVPSLIEPPYDGLGSVPISADKAEVAVSDGALLVFVPRLESPDAEEAQPHGMPTFRLKREDP